MKAALIYRRNDLFDEHIEIVRGVLIEEFGNGFDIEQTFPRGTPLEEISKWYEENKDRIASYQFVLSDETCRSDRDKFCTTYQRSADDRRMPRGDILDFIFNVGTYGLIGAEFSEVSDLEKQVEHDDIIRLSDSLIDKVLEETRRAYVKALQMVKEIPRTALILPDRIRDHFPFRNLDYDRMSYEDKRRNPGLMLQEWFIEAGIPTVYYVDDSSISVRNSGPVEMARSTNWVVYDRHAKVSVKGDVTVLHIPFDNFVDDLKKNGLIEFSETIFGKAIERKVREKISKIRQRT